MKNFNFKLLLMLILSWIGQSNVQGQLIGTSGYIIGDNVEIGINDSGHEGAPRLIPSHNRSNQALGSPVYFGFVANPQLDGWGSFDGDFFTPGTPENGFGIEVGGVNYSNNAAGDTYNETFFPVFVSGLDIYDYHLMLFNRWGELVFESYDANYGWNGSYGGGDLVDDGVYIWKMEFGETMSDKRHYVDGHVTVIK